MSFSAYMPSITEVYQGTKYILNGVDNKNYKLFADAYDDSVTNSACINDICNYIVGDGLINEKGGDSPYIHIPEKDLRLLTLDYKIQGAYAIQIVWGKFSKKPEKIYHVPINQTGLDLDTTQIIPEIKGYWYCYDWTRKTKYTPIFVPKFDGKMPDNGVNMIIVQRPSNEPLFPRPDWFSALRWAQDEGLMAEHSYSDIKTGFSGQKVINWVGGRGLTDEQKRSAANTLRENFSGIDGKRVIVSVNDTEENSVVVDNIEPVSANAAYINYTEEAERKIMIAHSYPSILLAGSKTGFSSNADEIATATKSLYRRVIRPNREVILEGLRPVFEVIDPSIKLGFKDFEDINLDTNNNEPGNTTNTAE